MNLLYNNIPNNIIYAVLKLKLYLLSTNVELNIQSILLFRKNYMINIYPFDIKIYKLTKIKEYIHFISTLSIKKSIFLFEMIIIIKN